MQIYADTSLSKYPCIKQNVWRKLNIEYTVIICQFKKGACVSVTHEGATLLEHTMNSWVHMIKTPNLAQEKSSNIGNLTFR